MNKRGSFKIGGVLPDLFTKAHVKFEAGEQVVLKDTREVAGRRCYILYFRDDDVCFTVDKLLLEKYTDIAVL